MTKLYISEFKSQGVDNSLHTAPIVSIVGVAPSLTVTYTTSASVQSAALAATTAIIRILATSNCYIAVGTNPTADTTGIYVQANTPEYFGILVAPGTTLKLAVIGA